MKKEVEKTPEDVARDLEDIDFAEIADRDLQEIFGGLKDSEVSNMNCCC